MCCIVLSGEPYLLVFPLQVIKCSFSSLNLSALGIYGARLISPSELKISSMSAEVENVLSVSSCWRPKPILLFPSFFFFFLLACSPPVQSYKRFSHFLPPLCSCMSFISFSTPFFVASSLRTPGQMLNQFSLREWEQSWSLYERAYSHITPFSSHKNTEIVVIFHLFYSFIFLPFTVIFIFKFQDLSMPSIINVNRN